MNDEILIKYIKKKQEKGLELLIESYGSLIKAIVKKHLYNLESVQNECIDDILLSIWNNITRFDYKKNTLKNWIGAISKYKAIDYKRKYFKYFQEEDISSLTIESSYSIDKELLANELKSEIYSLLNSLSDKDKDIFIKHYIEEKNIDLVSAETGLKPSVIYNRLSRGRKKLKKTYQEINN